VLLSCCLLLSVACAQEPGTTEAPEAVEPEGATPAQVTDKGVQMIPVETPKGTFQVWTKRVGENPTMKVLLLHGGPGVGHEYLEPLAEFLPDAGIEVYLYDQLGAYLSDQPDDHDLWHIPRFVDEVEQVRQALGLGPDSFYLFGHSWGGMLAMEYALANGDALKGLIISNMMASIPLYNRYAEEVLMPQMDQDALAEIKALEAAEDYGNPRYMELLTEHHYVHHFIRMPPDQWPDALNRAFEHMNHDVYVLMQGPSELGASGRLAEWDRTGDLCRLAEWDRTGDLSKIKVPTLVIGARYDTMDPGHMRWMADELPNGSYLHCPEGGHLSHMDDQDVYMDGVIQFIKGVDEHGRS
jgi:proline iminopeptidase